MKCTVIIGDSNTKADGTQEVMKKLLELVYFDDTRWRQSPR